MLKLLPLALLLIGPLPGQFSATFIPAPLAATDRIFANARDAGIWSIRVCSETNVVKSIARERILNAAPDIPFLPTAMARDLLTRNAGNSKWAVLGRVGGFVLQYVPAGLSLWGTAAGDASLAKSGAISGLALSLLALGVSRTSARAPNPEPYFSQFLPEAVVLQGGACAEYLAASALIRGAKPVGPLLVDPEIARIDAEQSRLDRERLAKLRIAHLIATGAAFEMPPAHWTDLGGGL
jgi:hypothetical protein